MAVAEDLGVVAPAPEAAPAGALKPPARVKLAYCFGQAVESSYLTIATYVFFYYTAVLGLPGTWVGAGVAISMVLDAVGDPLIGSWSDGVRSKYGRRLPLMLIGAPLTMLMMGLLFAPPSGLTAVALFVWLTFTKMGVRAFASVYNIPYFALGGEMSDDYVERSRIVSYRLLAGIVASSGVYVLGAIYFRGEGGLQRPENYPAFAWTIATIMLVSALICVAGLWRYAVSLPQPTGQPRPMLQRLPGELVEIFRNSSFRILFLSMLAFASAAGINAALNNHAYIFVWRIRPETIQMLGLLLLFGIFIGVPLSALVMRWLEKRTTAVLGFGLVIVTFLVLPGMRLLGAYAPTGEAALTALVPTILVMGVGTGLVFVAYPAMMADAAEDHEHQFGHRREGLYFAGLAFAGKAAAGVGALIGGVALDLLHFPREAGRQVHAVLSEHLLTGLVFWWGVVPALISVVGALALIPYAISRRRHEAIIQDLRTRRASQSTP